MKENGDLKHKNNVLMCKTNLNESRPTLMLYSVELNIYS